MVNRNSNNGRKVGSYFTLVLTEIFEGNEINFSEVCNNSFEVTQSDTVLTKEDKQYLASLIGISSVSVLSE